MSNGYRGKIHLLFCRYDKFQWNFTTNPIRACVCHFANVRRNWLKPIFGTRLHSNHTKLDLATSCTNKLHHQIRTIQNWKLSRWLQQCPVLFRRETVYFRIQFRHLRNRTNARKFSNLHHPCDSRSLTKYWNSYSGMDYFFLSLSTPRPLNFNSVRQMVWGYFLPIQIMHGINLWVVSRCIHAC